MLLLQLLLSTAAAAPCGFAPLVVAEPLGTEVIDETCLTLDLDLAGRAFAQQPDIGLSRGVALSRAREELALRAPGDVLARVAFTEARSGGEDGYVGINGEAWVFQLQIAEGRWDWRQTGLAAAAGLVDHPWTMTVQSRWARREIAPPLTGDRGWVPRNDMGGWLGWTSRDAWVSVTVAALTGEGANRRERNTGVNLSATAHVRPLATSDGDVALEVAAYAEEGSRGIAQARDHRAGAAVIVTHPWVVGGVDGLLGWGLGGDANLLPGGVSGWVRTGDEAPVVGWMRLDTGRDARDLASTTETMWMLGGGPRLPLAKTGPGHLVVGYQGRRFGADAAAVSGGEVISATDLVFVQLGARLRGVIPVL
jgi:hypothetical protein